MKTNNVFKSVQYAWRGFSFAFRNEQNFRIELVMGALVIGLGIFLQISRIEFIVVVLLILAILVLELINTAIEKMIDVVKPRLHEQVKIVKDIAAAMVLCAAMGAFLVGFIIFIPAVIEYIM